MQVNALIFIPLHFHIFIYRVTIDFDYIRLNFIMQYKNITYCQIEWHKNNTKNKTVIKN